jgi:hypothetical protein
LALAVLFAGLLPLSLESCASFRNGLAGCTGAVDASNSAKGDAASAWLAFDLACEAERLAGETVRDVAEARTQIRPLMMRKKILLAVTDARCGPDASARFCWIFCRAGAPGQHKKAGRTCRCGKLCRLYGRGRMAKKFSETLEKFSPAKWHGDCDSLCGTMYSDHRP